LGRADILGHWDGRSIPLLCMGFTICLVQLDKARGFCQSMVLNGVEWGNLYE